MSYQVIARKYRPQAFDGVVGQEAIARTLRNAIARERVAHAYMFCGPRGVGKTSMARLFARALNCLSTPGPTADPCGTCDLCVRAAKGEDLDVLEIDAASNRRVDDARTLIANVSFHPTRARFKVYIVDEVHMLTTEAFNALLKTLEEPPPHVKFVFATTDPQKVPATILSRCQRFDFRPVPSADIAKLLGEICASEGLRAEPEALRAIAHASLGGVRDAESLLEQLGTLGAGAIRLEDLHALLGTVPARRMQGLFDAVASGDTGRVLAVAGEILDQGTDPGELLRQSMRHAHDLMLVQAQGPRAADVEADEEGRRALAAQAALFSDATLVYAVTVFSEALRNARQLGEGRLFAETALARLAGHREMRFLDQVVRELHALEKRVGQPSSIPAPAPRAVAAVTAARTDPPAARAPAPSPEHNGTLAAPTSATAETAVPAPVIGTGPARAPEVTTVAAPAPEDAARDVSEAQGPVAPTGAPPDGSTATPPDVATVRARWPDVREAASRGNALLRAALQSGEVVDLRGSAVIVGFRPSASFHRAKVDEPQSRDRVQAAFEAVLGSGLTLETVEREGDPASAADTDSRRGAAAGETARDAPPERLTAAETEAVRSSPITRLVEQELGGVVVAMQREE